MPEGGPSAGNKLGPLPEPPEFKKRDPALGISGAFGPLASRTPSAGSPECAVAVVLRTEYALFFFSNLNLNLL